MSKIGVLNCLVKVSCLDGSNLLVATDWSISAAVEFRLIVDETVLVDFGARLEVSIRRSVSTPLTILPLESTP
ncbi:hypothetical protein D3C78_1335890 [compost metagenome]